jgi:hypothetical protein
VACTTAMRVNPIMIALDSIGCTLSVDDVYRDPLA